MEPALATALQVLHGYGLDSTNKMGECLAVLDTRQPTPEVRNGEPIVPSTSISDMRNVIEPTPLLERVTQTHYLVG